MRRDVGDQIGGYAPEGMRRAQTAMAGQTMPPAIFGYAPGMRQVQKIPMATLVDSRARPESLQTIRIINLGFCAGGMRRIYIYIYIYEKIILDLNILGFCARVCASKESEIPKTCYRSPSIFSNT